MISIITDFLRKNSFIFLCVLAFGIISHGYCYFSMNLSHDSLNFDHTYSANLGRWMHTLVCYSRGIVSPPVLIGFLSLFYISLSAILLNKLFNITSKTLSFLVCGVLVTNFTYTYIAATYIYFLDVSMLAVMFATLSVYIGSNIKSFWSIPLSAMLLMLAIALYQAYLQVFAVLCVLLLIYKFAKNENLNNIFVFISKFLLISILSLSFYYISLKLSVFLFNISFTNDYNSINNAGIYFNIKGLYSSIYSDYFHLPSYKYNLQKFIFVLSIITSLFLLIAILRKQSLPIFRILICFISIIIFIPFASNCVYMISNGLMHNLMKYSYVYIFLVPIILYNLYTDHNEHIKFNEAIKSVIVLPLIVFFFNASIFSNQVYWLKDLQAKASISFMTRVLSQLDSLDGFTPEKRLCFIGSLYNNKYMRYDVPFNIRFLSTGLSPIFSFTYDNYVYIRMISRQNYRNFDDCDAKLLAIQNELNNIPEFPQKGSVIFVDDTAFVKLSNN